MLVATAGHVDHGKTSLVKQLTGTNTDRLKEEQQRGLTIELGYAFARLGVNKSIGFIDVPGHHRFINTMISGINGIDLGMLVVAADDGPMPQTHEHLTLLRFLGVDKFAGVITKSDLVDRARLDEVRQQTASLIPNSPLCEVSNRTGDGLESLQSILEKQIEQTQQRVTEQQFRLYIDRVFVKKGVGTVITGTCLSGSVNIGDELRLHAAINERTGSSTVRVRAIHTQGLPADESHAGQRCALNIVSKSSRVQIQRGDFLCTHPAALPSSRLDTRCWFADEPDHAIKHLGRVKLYLGTRRIAAKTYLLERDDNKAQDTQVQRIQLILEQGIVAFSGDRFILRNDSETRTLGGGIVIDPDAPQRGKSRDYRLRYLDALTMKSPSAALEQMLFSNDDIVSLNKCLRIWNLSQQELDRILKNTPFNNGALVKIPDDNDELLLSTSLWMRHLKHLDQQLARWHGTRPMERGIQPDLLRAQLQPQTPAYLFKALLNDRIQAGKIIYCEQLIRAAGHRPSLSPQIQQQWQKLEAQMQSRGLDIPLRSELQQALGFEKKQLEALTRPAIKAGDLFEIGEKRLALPHTINELAALIRQFKGIATGISVIDAKQVFGLGRNQTIEILEFFDRLGFTKRIGNLRLIANNDAPSQANGSKEIWS